MSSEKGRFVVLSAPSGSGKSSVLGLVRERVPGLVYSVSYTTRQPRPGEVDGRDYHFVTAERFRAMAEAGAFLEWAEVFGRHYGTGREWVEARLGEGRHVVADLDVAGAASVKKQMPSAVLVFMAPPSALELRRRLTGRHTESEDQVHLRLKRVKMEVAKRGLYDFLVVNDDLARAADEMAAIIETGQGRKMAESESFWQDFFAGV